MTPTMRNSSSITGMPEMPCAAISRAASFSVISGRAVTTSVVITYRTHMVAPRPISSQGKPPSPMSTGTYSGASHTAGPRTRSAASKPTS
jgi:hypothetical protein